MNEIIFKILIISQFHALSLYSDKIYIYISYTNEQKLILQFLLIFLSLVLLILIVTVAVAILLYKQSKKKKK